MSQPITATQLGVQTGLSSDQCSYLICKLTTQKMLVCLNLNSRRSRLYWLTKKGVSKQQELRSNADDVAHDFPDIDWDAYGHVCFSHRSIVVRTLHEPMQPAKIKRMAWRNDSKIRFSANNCRDAIKFLKAKNVVQPVVIHKKKYLRYELTDQGRHMQRLMWQAEVKRF